MKLHGFICASQLYPNDKPKDEAIHVKYFTAAVQDYPRDWVRLTVIQNGCEFSTAGVGVIRHPFPKNLGYNWLLCDANCEADYWLFVPEDCLISPRGWEEIRKHMDKGKECFALSKDPKALIARRGIFRDVSPDIQALCDMNCLGKEIGGVILRGELERRNFHCITRNWKRIATEPNRWGNELYKEINCRDHPYDINKTRSLPTLFDYGLDGWKASREEVEAVFLRIVDDSLAKQRQSAEALKGLISHYGPLITELPYKGLLHELWNRWQAKV